MGISHGICQGSSKKPDQFYIHRERKREKRDFISFKELAQMILKAGKSKIHRPGWQAGNSGRIRGQGLQAEALVFKETLGFALKAFNFKQVHPYYEVNFVYLELTDCRCYQIYKIPSGQHLN